MKIVLTRLFALLFTLQMFSPGALAAQLSLGALDVESPSIQFDKGDPEIVEGVKTFTAVVTDNVGVKTVTLYFKHAGDVTFKARDMKKDASQPDLFTVDLMVDPVITSSIEVYIKAEDLSGNSVFEGQKFLPLTYKIVPRKSSESVLAQEGATGAKTEEEKEEGMSTMTKILIGVGTVALIGLAAGGGGSSDDGGGGGETGTITITTPIPD